MTDPKPDSPDLTHSDAADEAAAGQIRVLRQRLVDEGTSAGIAEEAVKNAVDHAADHYSRAPIRSFVGILVERTVRNTLGLPRRLT